MVAVSLNSDKCHLYSLLWAQRWVFVKGGRRSKGGIFRKHFYFLCGVSNTDYGAALEKCEWPYHLVSPDTILCCPAQGEPDFRIWLCYPVPLGGKQFVGKTTTAADPRAFINCQKGLE